MRKDVRLVESDPPSSLSLSLVLNARMPTWPCPFGGRLPGSLVVALIKLKLGLGSMLKLEAVWWVWPHCPCPMSHIPMSAMRADMHGLAWPRAEVPGAFQADQTTPFGVQMWRQQQKYAPVVVFTPGTK